MQAGKAGWRALHSVLHESLVLAAPAAQRLGLGFQARVTSRLRGKDGARNLNGADYRLLQTVACGEYADHPKLNPLLPLHCANAGAKHPFSEELHNERKRREQLHKGRHR